MTKNDLKNLLQPIKIVKILSVEKHLNADRLLVAKVTDGISEFTVVTGAPNTNVNDSVGYLGVNDKVPGPFLKDGTEFILSKKDFRGVESEGMLLAEDEMGVSSSHEGLLVLNAKVHESDLGKSLIEVLPEILEKAAIFNKIVEISPALQKRIDLVMSVGDSSVGGEVIGTDELPALLASGEKLYTYDGFEPSGQMHIAQGIIRAINTNKMIDAGFVFRMWVADWFGYLNNKMGGDINKIKRVGEYFIEIWKASGMNMQGTEFLWTSDYMNDPEYWATVLKISTSASLNRILKTTEIMGRSETDDLSAGQIIYPCMQTADIFHVMKAQVTQLGMDQRKVNMLARDVGEKIGFWKPIVVSHGMLQGLGKPAEKDADSVTRAISMKMSKSKPDTAIFMTDTRDDIQRKIIGAYCPPEVIVENPVLAYCKQIIFEAHYLVGKEDFLKNGFEIKREEKFGGDVTYKTYQELESAYAKGELFPLDLKNAVIDYINQLVKPVRDHFENDSNAKKILEDVRSYQITR